MSYTVEGFGEAKPPQDFFFWWLLPALQATATRNKDPWRAASPPNRPACASASLVTIKTTSTSVDDDAQIQVLYVERVERKVDHGVKQAALFVERRQW
jgi:hypothetical protein